VRREIVMSPNSPDRRAALEALRSPDARSRADAIDVLTTIGEATIPDLVALIRQPSADVRAAAMDALARIATPGTEPAFERGLSDADQRVRSHAAAGLVRVHSPRALAACLRTLNDAPDELHLDVTPSVRAVAEMGLPAVPALLDLLSSPQDETRLHAQRALEGIIARRHGFRPGEGFPDPGSEQAARAAWLANGDYDFQAPAGRRVAAVDHWREWLRRVEQ